jgi:hypothetical protein
MEGDALADWREVHHAQILRRYLHDTIDTVLKAKK